MDRDSNVVLLWSEGGVDAPGQTSMQQTSIRCIFAWSFVFMKYLLCMVNVWAPEISHATKSFVPEESYSWIRFISSPKKRQGFEETKQQKENCTKISSTTGRGSQSSWTYSAPTNAALQVLEASVNRGQGRSFCFRRREFKRWCAFARPWVCVARQPSPKCPAACVLEYCLATSFARTAIRGTTVFGRFILNDISQIDIPLQCFFGPGLIPDFLQMKC